MEMELLRDFLNLDRLKGFVLQIFTSVAKDYDILVNTITRLFD